MNLSTVRFDHTVLSEAVAEQSIGLL